ncbi:MAG: hypothetical protein KGL39_13050 [Patescibacteria group bacterium]|nr:hypothetical protein [Patescibacteria group bacterium]
MARPGERTKSALDYFTADMSPDFKYSVPTVEKRAMEAKTWEDLAQISAAPEDYDMLLERAIELIAGMVLTPGDCKKLDKVEGAQPDAYKTYLYHRHGIDPKKVLHPGKNDIRTIVRVEGEGYAWADPAVAAQDEKHVVHELIRGDLPQRFAVDLDANVEAMAKNGHTPLDVVKALLRGVVRVIAHNTNNTDGLHHILPRLAIAISPPFTTKFSLHLVYADFLLANYEETAKWAQQLREEMGEFGQYVDKIHKATYGLRVLLSTKEGRRKVPTEWSLRWFTDPHSYLICPPRNEHTFEHAVLPPKYSTPDTLKPHYTNQQFTEKECLEISMMPVMGSLWFRDVTTGGLMRFDRRLGCLPCGICGNGVTHGNASKAGDGAYVWKWPDGNVFAQCRRAPDGAPPILLKKGTALPPVSFWQRVEAKMTEEKLPECLAKLKELPADYTVDRDAKAVEESTDILPALHSPDPTLTLFASNMGTGKTKLVLRLIAEALERDLKISIFIVSYRKALGREMKAKVEKICEGLRSRIKIAYYEDDQGRLTRVNNVNFVQVESLWRIDLRGNYPMITILDEVDSTARQFMSGRNKATTPDALLSTLEDLLRASRHVIALDAMADANTVAWLNSFNHNKKLRVVVNTHQPRTENIVKVTTFDYALLQALEMLGEGKKVAIACTAKDGPRGAKAVADRIAKLGLKVKVYHSETSSEEKKNDFADLKNAWSGLDAVVYTPTIEAGVSYEEKHFHAVIGLIDAATPIHVGAVGQMLRRIRCADETLLGLTYSWPIMSPRGLTPEEIKDDLATVPELMIAGCPRRFDADNNRYAVLDSLELRAYLAVEQSRRYSQKYFLELLRYVVTLDGSIIKIVQPEHKDETTVLRTEMKAAAIAIKAEELEDIFSAPEIDQTTADEIADKPVRTPDEYRALQRYYVFRAYDMLGEERALDWFRTWFPGHHRTCYRQITTIRNNGKDFAAAITKLWEDMGTHYDYMLGAMKRAADHKEEKQLNVEVSRALNAKTFLPQALAMQVGLNILAFESPDDRRVVTSEEMDERVAANQPALKLLCDMREKLGMRNRVDSKVISRKIALQITNSYLSHVTGYKIAQTKIRWIGPRGKQVQCFDYAIDTKTVKTSDGDLTGFDIGDAPKLPPYVTPTTENKGTETSIERMDRFIATFIEHIAPVIRGTRATIKKPTQPAVPRCQVASEYTVDDIYS